MNYRISPELSDDCQEMLWSLKENEMPHHLFYSSMNLTGGFNISNLVHDRKRFKPRPHDESVMTFSILDTANRNAQTLRKMDVDLIYLDCDHYYHFISNLNGGVLSNYIDKTGPGAPNLGYIKISIEKYVEQFREMIKTAGNFDQSSFNFSQIK